MPVCPSLRDAVGEYERGIIARTMAVTAGNISEAAKTTDVPKPDPSKKGKTDTESFCKCLRKDWFAGKKGIKMSGRINKESVRDMLLLVMRGIDIQCQGPRALSCRPILRRAEQWVSP